MEKLTFFVLQCIYREATVVSVFNLCLIGFLKKYYNLVLNLTVLLRDRNVAAKTEKSQMSQDLFSSKMVRLFAQKHLFQGLLTAVDSEAHSIKQLVNLRKWQ